jgi:Cdc6-like AAA superfamily ATPase
MACTQRLATYIRFRQKLEPYSSRWGIGLNYDELLGQQLTLALDSEEIVSQLRTIDIARDYLVQCVHKAEPELWQQVASERRRVQEAEANHATVQRQLFTAKYGSWYERLLRRRRLADLERREGAAQATLDIALDSLKKVLLEDSILPLIRTSISGIFGTSYSTELRITYSPGLSEVFDPRYEIKTHAAQGLSSILSVIRGGSIGLAGPRGSGKTTLIESVCNGRIKPFESPVLALQVSAPVVYEPRDFVLHLFAKLCETLTGPTSYADSDDSETRYRRGRRRNYILRLVLLLLSLIVGLGLIGIGILRITGTKITWPDGALYIVGGLLLPFIAYFGLLLLQSISIRDRLLPSASSRLKFDQSNPPIIDIQPSEQNKFRELRTRALALLDNIQYQQTYTSGWSGTLKVPIVEGTLSGGQSLARQTMSYPEVVSELRAFLSDIVISFRPVIIGIDELDKMESGDQARKFLNDIKGVFGINGCYFLVSVSIDAMSSFERRGMPFRDAFDSSFDDIVLVSPLTYNDARAVINHRVIGVSNQFVALAYVIAGGLTRDLIRAMRKLVTLSKDSPNKTLQSLSARLIADEITAKLAAVEVALQKDMGSRWKDRILDVILQLDSGDENSLLKAARMLRASMPSAPETDSSSARLAADTAAYLYFAATIVQYFNDSLNEQHLKEAESSNLLDDFAECRQSFVMGATVAWQKIDGLRATCQLETLSP